MKTAYGQQWNVSLHGGHSSDFCDHGKSPLREMLEAAVARGMAVYGVAEHGPRVESRFLYPEEIELGWDVERLMRNFEAYAEATRRYADEFADRLTVLRAFEIEVVPQERYVALMRAIREQFDFDYVVGSVHYVDEFLFDYSRENFEKAVEMQGGLEPFAVKYYETLAEMVGAVRPEVAAHFDLIRKYAPASGGFDTPAVRRAAETALEAIRRHGCLLEVNTGGYRNGLAYPYPEPWVVEQARAMGIPFCFGDDSHAAEDVGADIPRARNYLLQCGIKEITILVREAGAIGQRTVALE